MEKGGEKQGHKWYARIGVPGAYKYFYSAAEVAAHKARQAGGAVKKAAGNINKEAHKAYWKGFNKLDKNKDGRLTPFKETIRPEDDPKKNGKNVIKKYGIANIETGMDHELKADRYKRNKRNARLAASKAEDIKKERQQRKQSEVKEKLNRIAAGYDKKKEKENKNKGKFDSTKKERSEKAKQIRDGRLDRYIKERHERLGIIPATRTVGKPARAGDLIGVRKDRIGTNGYEPAKNSTKIKRSNRNQGTNDYEPARNSTKIKRSNRNQSSLATQQEQERFNTETMRESERLNREQIQELERIQQEQQRQLQQQQQQMIDNSMNMMLFSKNNRKRLKYKNSSKA